MLKFTAEEPVVSLELLFFFFACKPRIKSHWFSGIVLSDKTMVIWWLSTATLP